MRRVLFFAAALGATALAVACGSSGSPAGFTDGKNDATADGASGGDGAPDDAFVPGFGDTSSSGDAGADCGPNLTGVLRDFHQAHPDFEKFLGDDRGIVETNLGADGKPVYAPATTSPTTTGKADFDQWYRDVPGINFRMLFTVPMAPLGNGVSSYDNPAFFPLDNQGFGNEGNNHNFHFTFELHTEFVYKGGEVFTFIGDDDVFTFVNGKLAIDLGGVHSAETATVDLDARAAELAIAKGQKYPLDVFQAERHTTESHFRIDTSIEFTNCQPILR